MQNFVVQMLMKDIGYCETNYGNGSSTFELYKRSSEFLGLELVDGAITKHNFVQRDGRDNDSKDPSQQRHCPEHCARKAELCCSVVQNFPGVDSSRTRRDDTFGIIATKV